MIDFARILISAGDGGNGSGSFHKIKGKRYGKADGGNGGLGGSVYIEATADLNTLESYRYVKEYKAEGGQRGDSRLRKGASAEDLVLKVPVGTQVRVSESVGQWVSESENPENIYDLTDHGQKVLVARGGEGGRGNSHLRDELGRRPRVGEKGEPGEVVNLTLELKLIADVGLIGLPNAGKSTLLSKLTAAQPKIANYPFTTLEPNLGVLSVGKWISGSVNRKTSESVGQNSESPNHRNTKSLVIADIPGLIEGASVGKGLGDLFLRHIERTKMLLHLVDISVSQWGSKPVNQKTSKSVDQKINTELPKHRNTESQIYRITDTLKLWNDYQVVRQELKSYSRELLKKKEIVVLTKTDLVEKEAVSAAVSFFKGKRKKVVAISAQTGEGLEALSGMFPD